MIGKDETHRPADVRHRAQKRLAFDQAFAHQPELEVLEIAQAAVEELGGGGGRRGGEVVHLGQGNLQATARRVARDPAPVDAAADDEDVQDVVGRLPHSLLPVLRTVD
jgi:hypothetical protein